MPPPAPRNSRPRKKTALSAQSSGKFTIKYSTVRNQALVTFIQDLMELKEETIETLALVSPQYRGVTPTKDLDQLQTEWVGTLKVRSELQYSLSLDMHTYYIETQWEMVLTSSETAGDAAASLMSLVMSLAQFLMNNLALLTEESFTNVCCSSYSSLPPSVDASLCWSPRAYR
jgi:hypothetical protein